MTEFDLLADHYDETRGGEQRGDDYAADIEAQLPAGDNPILEIGVGTGVVALGLRRRGRTVVGLDLSGPMLVRAHERLGPVVAQGDAMRSPIATASVAHAVSVWVVHSVADPVLLFQEAARVLRPGGQYIVCANQQPAADDEVGQIITAMSVRVDERRGAARPRGVTVDEVREWGELAGFKGRVYQLQRQWRSTAAEELAAIAHRTWPAMRELDEDAILEVTRPAIEALQARPATEIIRRATAGMIVFDHQD